MKLLSVEIGQGEDLVVSTLVFTFLIAERHYLALALANFQARNSLDGEVIACQRERFLFHVKRDGLGMTMR